MAKYKPGDMKKIVDTVIALDILAIILLRILRKYSPEAIPYALDELSAALAKSPAILVGANDLLREWKEELETPPKPEVSH